MPRPTRTQTTIRAGAGESNVNMPSDPVSDYAPYVHYINIERDRSAGVAEMRIGEAAAGFGSTLARVAVQQHEEDNRRRRLQGQADALNKGVPVDWGTARTEILNDPQKGQEYWSAFSQQGAKVAAAAKSASLVDEFSARTDIDSVEKFDKWFADNTKADIDAIAGLDDPETMIAYGATLEAQELKLRSAASERATEKAYTETVTNFNMVVQNELEAAFEGGASGRDLLNILVRQRQDGEAVLLQADDINEAQVRAVGAYAEAEGKPELLNLFDYPHADARDPSKQVPGLAYTKVHGAKIEDYRAKANKEHDAKVAENLKATGVEAEKRMLAYIRDGDLAQAEVFADLMLDEKVFTPATYMHYYKEMHTVNKKELRMATNVGHLTSGRAELVPADERKEAIEAYGERILGKAQTLGTPEAAHEATKDILSTGAQLGEMYPRFKSQLSKLNVLDPEQFSATMSLAQMTKAMAPSLYTDNTSEATRVEIAMAQRMLERGEPQDRVMANLQEMRTPEAKARRKEIAGDTKLQARRRARIKNVLGLKADHANAEEITTWMSEAAIEYMTLGGTDDYDDALTYAEEQYEASFAEISLGDGRGKVSVYKGQLGLPDTIEQQMQWFSESFTEEMRTGDETLDKDISFYLVPDANTRHLDEREFIVMDSLGRVQMEVRDGIGVPMRIGQRDLEGQWRQGMVTKAEQEQERQQLARMKRDAQVLRNRKYYGVSGDELRRRYRASGKGPEGEPDISPARPKDDLEPDAALTTAMETAVDMIADYEGFRSDAYAATANERERGIWTVGYGETDGVTANSRVTKEEAKLRLAKQVQRTADAVEHAVGPAWDKLTDGQQAVVVSLAYNVDKDVVGQFKRSRALKALRKGDLETFKYEAFDPKMGFVKQRGKILKGLVKRRQDELAKFEAATTTRVARNYQE